MFTYPQELRNECKNYFKEECNVDIDDEKADLYLESLANFYSAIKNIATDE